MNAPLATKIVQEQEVHSALDFLRDSALAIGKAKERARRAEHMLKHIEALEFKASDERSAEARKADARTSQTYVNAINEDAEATGELAKLYSLREAAALKVEAWRSESATLRSVKL